MRVYTRIVSLIETGQVLEADWFEYDGPVAEMKATSEEKALQQQQAQFYATLQANYSQQFAKQSAILDSIKATFDPILKAGVNQYGFNDAEDKTLRTQASESTARNYEAASKAVENKFAAQGGGNTFIPSGARAQLETDVAAAAAGDESTKELGITEAGYDLGRRNFEAAANAEAGAAQLYNPQSYASNANQAGKEAFDSAHAIAMEGNGLWGAIGGILGGAASAFTGGFGTGLGQKVGG